MRRGLPSWAEVAGGAPGHLATREWRRELRRWRRYERLARKSASVSLLAGIVGGNAKLDPLPSEVHIGVMADLACLGGDVDGEVNALVVGIGETCG